MSSQLIQGNEACAWGALKAGVKFCAGYPITPSTDVVELLAQELPKAGGRFIQMEDEIASMGAVLGASVMGEKAMTVTSGPGFDLMQENIAFGAMAQLPCVVVNVQRSGPSTGGATLPAQGDLLQAKYGTSGDSPRIVLYPNSVEEIYRMTIQAFNYAEQYMTPVILLMDEIIGHMRENVDLEGVGDVEIVSRRRTDVPPAEYRPYAADETGIPILMPFGSGYRYVVQGMHHDVNGMPNTGAANVDATIRQINGKIDRHKERIWLWEEKETEDADILLVAVGCVSRSALEAVRQARRQGLKVGLFRPITVWPFPEEPLARALAHARAVLVPEMNWGQLIHKVKEVKPDAVKAVGLNKYDGTLIMPEEILKVIEEVRA